MKKQVILALALMIGAFSFAQKKEIKSAEKAIKSNNYADAKAAISAAESLISAMDDKTKAKFYLLKGQALYANGAGSNTDIDNALESFKTLDDLETKTGKKNFSSQADAIKVEMGANLVKKGTTAYENKNFAVASSNFEKAYRIEPADTIFLYNAATVAVMDKDYDSALRIYDELDNLGYTGISMQFVAINNETGEEEAFPSKVMRDLSVNNAKTHSNSKDLESESKVGEIAKNIALIYIDKGENEKAIAAIDKAKKTNPDDLNLILSEASIYYKMGDLAKYRQLISRALELNPDNVTLVFNLGVSASEENDIESARKYYKKAIEMDSKYSNAYMNLAVLTLDQEQVIIEEMNKLGTSAADNKKYDALKLKREGLYKEAAPYLAKVLELNPKDVEAAKTLMNIYSALDDTANFKALKAKVEALQNEN